MSMDTINGYKIIQPWNFCGNGKYSFAEKNGEQFFIKELVYPRFPMAGSESVRKERIKECEEYEKSRKQVIDALKKVALPNGNLLYPVEIFREGAFYYEVSYRAIGKNLDMSIVSRCSKDMKMMLIKTIIASLRLLDEAGVVYGDMKPENIQVVYDPKLNSLRGQIFDLTDSYLEKNPGKRDEVIGTTPYYSPELGKYIVESGKLDFLKLGEKKITSKSDIFAAAIVIHMYLTGGKMPIIPQKYNYVYEAVLDNCKPLIDSRIEPEVARILSAMLSKKSVDRPNAGEVLALINGIDL